MTQNPLHTPTACGGVVCYETHKIIGVPSPAHTTFVLDLRSSNNTGPLLLLFFFQFSFFLWSKLSLFLLFPFAFVFFPLITHFCFSLFESELCRTVAAKPRVRKRLQHVPELHLRTLQRFCQLNSKQTDTVCWRCPAGFRQARRFRVPLSLPGIRPNNDYTDP